MNIVIVDIQFLFSLCHCWISVQYNSCCYCK